MDEGGLEGMQWTIQLSTCTFEVSRQDTLLATKILHWWGWGLAQWLRVIAAFAENPGTEDSVGVLWPTEKGVKIY